MSRGRTIWKWTAGIAAATLVLAGAAVGALRVWLDHSTTFAPAVVARLERASGLQIGYSGIDARLGRYGPELVFRDARLYAPGEREPLATASAGRVGADWWRMLRTGRLTAGRVALEGAHVHVIADARGLELAHQGPLWRERDDAPLRLDRLPVGRVAIEDSVLIVEDRRTRRAPVRLDDVALELERNPSRVEVRGRARLPAELGARLEFEADADGDPTDVAQLQWRVAARVDDAALAGWSGFAPGLAPLPRTGRGDVRLEARGTGRVPDAASASVALGDVRWAGTAGYRRAEGDVRWARTAAGWTLAARDLVLEPADGRDAWRRGRLDVELGTRGGRLESLRVRAPEVSLAALGPLADALPVGTAREGFAATAPRGRLADVDVALARGPGVREWRVDGGFGYAGLAIDAWRALPGFAGVDGEVRGRGTTGTVVVRSRGLGFALPRYLAAPVAAREAGATLDWSWRADGWRFATDDVRVVAPDGLAGGKARLFVPHDGTSPRLVLDLALADVAAAGVVKYLPTRRFGDAAVRWLDGAFRAGRVSGATLEYAGEMRRFPFRDGGGEFRVVAQVEGLHVRYQDGWDDVEDAKGEVVFLNEGFSARLASARVGGLATSEGEVRIPDWRDAELAVRANARGDVGDALAFLQRSPLGPRLGAYFMGISGRGPLAARVALDLPLKRFADRVVEVEGRVERASARLPGVDDDVRGLAGTFRLRNRDVDVPSVTGTLLGGPFTARASTVDGARGERVLTVDASGRASGARLQPLLGITQGAWLDGTADWTAGARLPRLEWRPDPIPVARDAPPDVPPVPREAEVRWLPMTVHAESTLAGLAMSLPAPFAKAAAEARALKVDVAIDPGVAAGDAVPPRALRAAQSTRPPGIVARAQLGRDAAALAWRRDGRWTFDRGTLRFGGGAPQLREARGLWVDGRLATFDLGAWLRVKLVAAPGTPVVASAPTGLPAVLRGGTVAVDRFRAFGWTFPDVALRLDVADAAWRAQVQGPAAEGTILVPWDLRQGRPLALDMDRLVLVAADRSPPEGDAAATEEPADPRELPSLALDVRSLEIAKRRFGALQATLVRQPDGLRLERGTLRGASFAVDGRGAWTVDAQGPVTRLTLEATSTDVLDTLGAWGFAPTLSGASGAASARLEWRGGPEGDVLARLNGTARVSLQDGQLLTVQPGAGRMLGLMSVAALPRRLTLDFTDLTDEGFAYDTITGDFEFRQGDAHTANLVLKGPAAEIGVAGRAGLGTRDYDQTAVVTGHFGGPIAAAGALAGGPAVGAALLLFSKVFKEPLAGIARGYYRITGSWDKPKVERIGIGPGNDPGTERPAVGDARRSGATTAERG